MLDKNKTHVCAITNSDTSESMLPAEHPLAPLSRRLKRFLKKQILVSERNPQTSIFFLSSAIIVEEKKRQVESGSWIVHPFSVFRIYYEMWMTFVFLANLIYIPMGAAFGFLFIFDGMTDLVLNTFCLFDVCMNFFTGYRLPSNEVEMRPRKIAKHYVFGIYFTCDVLSSMPFIAFETHKYLDNIFSLLKIVRIGTLLKYTERSFHFFKIGSFYIRLIMVLFLIVHYIACVDFYAPLLIMRLTHGQVARDTFLLKRLGKIEPDLKTFLRWYSISCHYSTSYLLSIDLNFNFNWPVMAYINVIVFCIFGKIIMAVVTVILVNRYQVHKSVETKFYEMMSQIDAFMEVHKFPFQLQKRVHQYYKHKYRMKFFDENRFNDNISENLQIEIRYHQLSTLIKNVTIFHSIPSEVLEKLFMHLKKEIYLPQDVIITAGVSRDSMFFISSGTVAVFSPTGKEVCHLSDGDYFGEIVLLFPHKKTTANIIALEICEVYKLDRKSFKKCLENQADLYKKIQEEAKRRLKETHQIHTRQILVTPTKPRVL
ncbi:hypothetical protein Zmor_022235 [Zophobas morio]|uniref:Cyclic nucleotide-binding domain-containing protein n=1 Tax=Zophobas morio TaxID=2755281 RepID=A0AA38M593_9CUCU|nr:hypothetical protein Zmor_022235 [Zophobas morio]